CLGQDAPTTAHVEDALTPEPAEHAPEIFDAQRVQLVEPGEGSGVAPPDAGDPLHQALVLLGLGKAAEAGKLVGHERQIYGRTWRMVEDGGGWWRWLLGKGPVNLPGEESSTTLAVVEG